MPFLKRTRCGPGPLLPILIALVWMALTSTVIRAHDPGLSALDIKVSDGAISASLSIAAPDVALRHRRQIRRAKETE